MLLVPIVIKIRIINIFLFSGFSGLQAAVYYIQKLHLGCPLKGIQFSVFI